MRGEKESRRFVDPKSKERYLPHVPQGARKVALTKWTKKINY